MIAKMKAPSERDKVSMREEIEREMALTRLEDPSVVVDEVVGRSSKTPPSSLTIGSVIFFTLSTFYRMELSGATPSPS